MVDRIDLTTPTPSPPRPSLVTFLLDRSGSMAACLDATLEAFNAYLGTLKAEREARIQFSLLTFDSNSVDKLHVAVPIADIPPLTRATYVPRGGTPLIDAAIETIRAVSALVESKRDNPRVVICIQTDGQENASRSHTWAYLRDLVTIKQEQGWQFNFMGVGIDAYQQAMAMGVNYANTVSYDTRNLASTNAVFGASASNAADFVSGRSDSAAYTKAQRAAVGEKPTP